MHRVTVLRHDVLLQTMHVNTEFSKLLYLPPADLNISGSFLGGRVNCRS